MKTAFTLAVLGALAATPALAQEMNPASPQGENPGGQAYEHQAPGRTMGEATEPGHHQTANRETVRNVQQALVDQGYRVGAVDGRMGPRTREALRNFQQKQGLQASGRLDQQTLAALGVQGGPQQAQLPEERANPQAERRGEERAPYGGGTETAPGGGAGAGGGMESPPAGGAMGR